MCYSAEVSFGTWAFGMTCAFLLAQQGKFYPFAFVFTQMQLVEGLRWIDAVDERILAVLGKLVLFAQPIAAFYEAKAYGFILPYIIVQCLTELWIGSRDLRFVVADDGHFTWKWSGLLETLPYWIALAIGAYMILPPSLFLAMAGLFAYFYSQHSSYGTHGSLWCTWVNVLWVYYMMR